MNSEFQATPLAGTDNGKSLLLESYLADIADGSETALMHLYDSTVRQVFSLAFRITQSRPAAEEIVNDVFLKVWRYAKNYDTARGKPMQWLMIICRSKSLDHLRAIDATMSLTDMENVESVELAELANNPQDILQAVERHSAVHVALSKLNGRDRQILSLAFFHGMSQAEIAEHLELPLGTVKSGMRRALSRLGTQEGLS